MANSQSRTVVIAAGLLLAAYSVWLVAVEVVSGQDGLRPYVTDIEGPIALYGMNTAFVGWLLVGAGVLWLAAMGLAGPRLGGRFRLYALLQAGLLVGLAFDDRFGAHERMEDVIGIPDAIIIALLGVVQLVLIWLFTDLAAPDRQSRQALLWAAVVFAIMVGFDGLVASEQHLRLAAEEVTKLWGSALMVRWSWIRLRTLVMDEGAAGPPDVARSGQVDVDA